jgi:tetratricopeptide (TPR) repeat protein
MHREVVEVKERVLGKENPDTLTSMNNLASVLRDQGKYPEAEQMYREVMEVKERVLGKEQPSTLTSTNNLASVLSDQGKYREAEQMHREELEVRVALRMNMSISTS